VTLADGQSVWETTVAPPHGRTELERLVDIDSAVYVVDKDVFSVGFQGRAAMLALDSGQIWWARDASSERGLAVSEDAIFIADDNGNVTALQRRNGAPLWEVKTLHLRRLSGPVLDGTALVVVDYQGFVHWLSTGDGQELARMKTDGRRASNAPLAVGGKVFVMTDGGRLVAFEQVPAKTSG